MNCFVRNKFLLTILILFGAHFSFLFGADLTVVPQINVAISPDEFSLPAEFSQQVSFSATRNIVFFDSGDVQIRKPDTVEITNWALALMRNPSAVLTIKGYYSPKYDRIISPQAGMELANERAGCVLEIMTKKSPAIADRVTISKDHDAKAMFLADTASVLDMRVEFEIQFSGFSARSFYPAERSPYWRPAYKEIMDEISPKIENALINNPDVVALVIGYGFANDADSYRWLDFLREKLIEKIDKRFSQKICLFVDPNTKSKTPSATIMLLPRWTSAFGNANIENPLKNNEIQLSIEGASVLPNTFYMDVSLPDNVAGWTIPILSSALKADLSVIPTLPDEYSFDFIFPGIGISTKQVKLDYESESSVSGTWTIHTWQSDARNLKTENGIGLSFLAYAIADLAKSAKKMTITLSSSSSSREISSQRLGLLKESLFAELAFIVDKSKDVIEGWLEKHNTTIQIADVPQYSEHSLNQLEVFGENQCQITVQFSGVGNE